MFSTAAPKRVYEEPVLQKKTRIEAALHYVSMPDKRMERRDERRRAMF
jgi:hypothetical protein